MLNIIGISANYHDSACCLLRDGILIAAAEEERFSRRKHDPSLPQEAFRYCLRQGNIGIQDVDCVAYYETPHKKLARQLWMNTPEITETGLIELWRRAREPIHQIRDLLGFDGPIELVDHHEAHAASSYYYSGFDEAAILTVDAVGEWATTTYGVGVGKSLITFEEVNFPDSLGILYATITGYLGFSINDGEYKVMGLAAYGKPSYREKMRGLIEALSDGQFKLDLSKFDFKGIHQMFSLDLPSYFGQPPRVAESPVLPVHQDIAASLQAVLEDILLEKVCFLEKRTQSSNLCMAGGVSLNCVANARIRREGPFKQMFIQPAAGDSGGSLGAAALAHVKMSGQRPGQAKLSSVYLGPSFTDLDIIRLVDGMPLKYLDFSNDLDSLIDAVVDRLTSGSVVGWFQGRMEFGPRALGARSILADPRRTEMRDLINIRVKKREEFRPFAPAVLREKASQHFDLDDQSPFMLETCNVCSELSLPAITHVDGSARIQTVDRQDNERFARLLHAFESRTGCPILLNTSFNMRDEPIVCSPIDALLCFVRSDIETVVLEDVLIDRDQVDAQWATMIRGEFGSSKFSPVNAVYTFL